MHYRKLQCYVMSMLMLVLCASPLPAHAEKMEFDAFTAYLTRLRNKEATPLDAYIKDKEDKNVILRDAAKGRPILLHFWATWCGPCIMGIPHLTELQHEYGDKVTIVGVNIWQETGKDADGKPAQYSEKTLETVKKFVNDKGDEMGYCVAYDGGAKAMDTNWMKAAGRRGIPSAFVVDKTGTIAWIGHPIQLDLVLDEVTKGTWDIAKGEERIKAAYDAYEAAGKKYAEGLEQGEAAWNAAVAAYPALKRSMATGRFAGMIANPASAEAGCKLGNQLLADAVKAKNNSAVSELIGAVTPVVKSSPAAREFYLKAAEASFELTKPVTANSCLRLARAFFTADQPEKAREYGAKAVELAPEAQKEAMKKNLKKMEDEYAAASQPAKAADANKTP